MKIDLGWGSLLRRSVGLAAATLWIASSVAAAEPSLGDVAPVDEPAAARASGFSPSDLVTSQLQSEVLRYYRGVGVEPSDAELKSGVSGASDLLLANVSLVELAAAIDRAIESYPTGGHVLFEVLVPIYIRPSSHEAIPSGGDVPGQEAPAGEASGPEVRDDRRSRRMGTGLMISAFVAQSFSFSATVLSALDASAINGDGPVLWIVQASSIPFAPLGVAGFALRFGAEGRTQRLRWIGFGLVQAAVYSGVVGGFSLATAFSPGMGEEGILFVPGMFAHLGASAAFGISGGIFVGIARSLDARSSRAGLAQPSARSAYRGLVVPTVAPRDEGLVVGITGLF